MASPPLHPDIRRQLKLRLLELTPRAFELFAGDLLSYIGLSEVSVTRYVGDGGIDAYGEIVTSSGIVRIPTAVQVKRHRQNVQRADIDRFIGALSGQYAQGIFISTSQYAPKALDKATTSFPRVTPVDGSQVLTLMLQHQLGITQTPTPRLDEEYFQVFEGQAQCRIQRIHEDAGTYDLASSEEDLVTLRALSYELRIDQTTLRRWIERGKIIPYAQLPDAPERGFFFRRDQIAHIRHEKMVAERPDTGDTWRQEFLDFVSSRQLTKSYKPVFLKSLLKLVDRNGEVSLHDLAREFLDFYIQRQRAGLPPEFDVPLLSNPEQTDLTSIRRLIVKYPLDRFVLKGFLTYLPEEGIICFAPQLWSDLRFYELLDIQASAEAQLRYYYERQIK
jgi:hypothetical protein